MKPGAESGWRRISSINFSAPDRATAAITDASVNGWRGRIRHRADALSLMQPEAESGWRRISSINFSAPDTAGPAIANGLADGWR